MLYRNQKIPNNDTHQAIFSAWQTSVSMGIIIYQSIRMSLKHMALKRHRHYVVHVPVTSLLYSTEVMNSINNVKNQMPKNLIGNKNRSLKNWYITNSHPNQVTTCNKPKILMLFLELFSQNGTSWIYFTQNHPISQKASKIIWEIHYISIPYRWIW